MAFHFSLQAVLHLRQGVERQQELRLGAANQLVARAQRLIEQLEARRQELYAARLKQLSSGMTAVELQFELLCATELLLQRRDLEQQLARLQQLRDQQREILRQARRARESLELVRDQQLRVYQREAARREQRSLDDLFLLRRGYLRRG
jgi:flagellar export protein FliJ